MTSRNILEARHLTKRFATGTVVRDVTFRVEPGEVLGYLGPNGSGKTTTARMLTGLLEPTSGEVLIDNRNIQDDLVAFRRRLGYVPEEPLVYTFLSGREYLEFIGQLRELSGPRLSRKIDALLDLFGLASAGHQRLASYSKGMRQKILLSAALLHDPQVLSLDEPESGLDVASGLVLRHLIQLLAARGKAILYSSHLLEHIEKVCRRVLVLSEGRIVANDTMEHLRLRQADASLESIFAQLTVTSNPRQLATEIADAVALPI